MRTVRYLCILVLGGHIPSSNLIGERTASRVILYCGSTGAVPGGGANIAQSAGTCFLKEKRKKNRRIGLPHAYDAIAIHPYRGFTYSRRTPPNPSSYQPVLNHLKIHPTLNPMVSQTTKLHTNPVEKSFPRPTLLMLSCRYR